jgi:hypothetical protein
MPVELFVLSIIGIVASVPITAILTHHQRKMAEIIHRSGDPRIAAEVASLRNEVGELKQLMYQQMIALDSSTPSHRNDPLQKRLEH